MAGLGGDGFWLIAEADGKVHGINASGPAARLATLDTYRARSENGEVPVRGPLSALTIPGAVDGWRRAHERFGRLAWDELFDATILYAREGVPVTRSLATWLALDEQILRGCSETALIDKSYAETRRGLIAAEYACTSTKCPRAYLSSIPTRVARLRATQLFLRHGSGRLDRFGYPVDLPRLWQRGRRRRHGHHPTKSRCLLYA